MKADPAQTTWRALAEVALAGLRRTYADPQCLLPYTRAWDGQRATCNGQSVRYALIALLGLAKADNLLGPTRDLTDTLWQRIVQATRKTVLTAGDLGLALWAQAVYGGRPGEFNADRARLAFVQRPEMCDSVDLAWLLLGADHTLAAHPDDEAAQALADAAKKSLLALYNPATALFYRHARAGTLQAVSRRVACFANQIYPTLALALHARRTGCAAARDAARAVADHVCRVQGAAGQWWWLYDARDGRVVDGYPVFSVHQHGMAPMTLLETGPVVGRSYDDAVARGLQWVHGANELRASLVLREPGMILREIHRRGYGRGRRMWRGVRWCCGWQGDLAAAFAGDNFEINPECRPYELGWLLYAAGLALRDHPAALCRPECGGTTLTQDQRDTMNNKRVQLCGVALDALKMGDVLGRVQRAIDMRTPLAISVINVAKLVNMRRDERLRRSVVSGDIILADGMPLVWLSRLKRRPLPERVAGIDLMYRIFELADQRGWRVFLLGATAATLDRVAAVVRQRYPGLIVAGQHDGYFAETDEQTVAESIRQARPDVLLVAITSPKKEIFMERWGASMNVPVVHGVGGSFDILAGVSKRAPRWMQRCGLEWLYRLLQEPRRMWKRYLTTNTRFAIMALRDLLRRPEGEQS